MPLGDGRNQSSSDRFPLRASQNTFSNGLGRNASMKKATPSREAKKIRILVAKPGLDGHDRGVLVLCRAFRDAGMEVIYSGLLPTPEQVAQMAIDEDVDVVALSLLNGAHMTAFPKVIEFLRKKGGSDIAVVGGGIIPDEDKPKLERMGIIGNFGPGTSLNAI